MKRLHVTRSLRASRRTRWPVLAVALATAFTYSGVLTGPVADAAPGATLTALSITPTVDTTSGPQTVQVTAHATSPTPVASGWVYLGGMSGGMLQQLDPSQPATDADWVADLVIPQYVESGTWHVTDVFLLDADGGQLAYYDADQLAALGLSAEIAVTGAVDTTPPELLDVRFEPTSVDLSDGSAEVTLAVRATDSESGTRPASFMLRGPDGQEAAGYTTTLEGDTWRGSVTLAPYSDVGTWVVKSLEIPDMQWNLAVFDTDSLAQAGFTPTLQVSGPVDTTAPELTGLSFSWEPVDVSTSSQDVDLTWTVTEAGSGLQSLYLQLSSPVSGQLSLESALWLPAPGGSGSYTTTVTVPRYAAAGDWQVSYVWMSDARNNERTYTGATLPVAEGVDHALTVVDAHSDTTAPVLGTVSFDPPVVDVSDGLADVTISVTITDDLSGWAYGSYRVLPPSGNPGSGFGDEMFPPGGPTTSGTFTQTVTLRPDNEIGTWTAGELMLRDAVGNQRTYTLDQLGASFEVTGATETPPAQPEVYSVTPGNAKVTLAWWTPYAGSSPITSWDVETTPAGGTAVVTSYPVGSEVDPTLDVTGLTNGTAYTFRVRGVSAVGPGEWSTATSAVRPRTVPTAPQSLTATGLDAEMTLGWSAPSSNGGSPLLGYEVLATPAVGAPVQTTVGPGSTGVQLGSLTANMSYSVQVRALNAAGAGPWATTQVQATALVPASTRLSGKLSVTLTSMGSPLVGKTVYLIRADGTEMTHVVTGKGGIASAKLPAKAGKGQAPTYYWAFYGDVGYFPSQSATIG